MTYFLLICGAGWCAEMKSFCHGGLVAGDGEDGLDEMSFRTLVPKSTLENYVSLLLQHKRIVISGSTGTGKTYLAQQLAQHLVFR